MPTNDPYSLRALEYITCLGFLAVFSLFWRYLNAEPAPRRVAARIAQAADWFHVPEQVYFHPGHAWARVDGPGVMAVGIDDFAQRLVGPVVGVVLPPTGGTLAAGQQAWAIRADGKAVDVLAPVSGIVVQVNEQVIANPEVVNDDPYGRGWLLKVKVPRTASAVKGLTSGAAARQWIEGVTQHLVQNLTPELGHVYQDGGLPVQGFARAIDEERWDEIARSFLLS